MRMLHWNLSDRQDHYSRIHGSRLAINLALVGLIMLVIGFGAPPRKVQAQSTSLPAEVNKSFSPYSIIAGNTSRLSITIFNPNAFSLLNASWTDTLPAGITLANPVNADTTCGAA